MDNQRNLLLAVALSGLLILGWDVAMRQFYPDAAITASTEEVDPAAAASAGDVPGTSVVAADLPSGVTPAAGPVDLDAALENPLRVAIDAPRLAGSINLVGARIDDIVLKDHRQTIDDDSGPVRLFAPDRTDNQYFAEFGFLANAERLGPDVVWTADAERLTVDTPVTLTHTAADGLTYSIKLSIDDNYMLEAVQTVSNAGEAAAVVQPFSLINRTSANASADEFIVHAGPVGVFGGTIDEEYAYDDLDEVPSYTPEGKANWLGFTDRYWLSALVPGEGNFETNFRALGGEIYRSDLIYDAVTLPAGQSIEQTTQLFVGAKESAVLDSYEESGIDDFGLAISWGWFWFLEKPLLLLLKTLFDFVGNFGVAIVLLTVIIRGLLFPIAQKQFASMAAMKAVQPKMKAIQDRYKDDKQKQQQEIMKLYKDEKVNPLAGCLPLLIQIPIFFALYKVLILAIEMRHEPLVDFWIKDLSAPDPWTILNLFGLLPFEVTGFLGIGVLAVLLGVTMWLTFKLNPSAMDPMQQQIFNFMPWILMFVMAPFAAGLLLYWVTSNILTLAQQSYLYSKHPQLRAAAEKEKAEKERSKALEDQSKGEA